MNIFHTENIGEVPQAFVRLWCQQLNMTQMGNVVDWFIFGIGQEYLLKFKLIGGKYGYI